MDIILTSTGTQEPAVREYILDKTVRAGKKKLLFISTAGKEASDIAYLIEERERMLALPFEFTEYDISGKGEKELREAISNTDVIFVMGGAPFYLLAEIRKTNFEAILRDVGKDKVYLGQSAGSYMACPNAEMGLWKKPNRNTFGLTDFKGMGLVDFLFFAHFKEEYREIYEKKQAEFDMDVLAATDAQAIAVINGKREFVNF